MNGSAPISGALHRDDPVSVRIEFLTRFWIEEVRAHLCTRNLATRSGLKGSTVLGGHSGPLPDGLTGKATSPGDRSGRTESRMFLQEVNGGHHAVKSTMVDYVCQPWLTVSGQQ